MQTVEIVKWKIGGSAPCIPVRAQLWMGCHVGAGRTHAPGEAEQKRSGAWEKKKSPKRFIPYDSLPGLILTVA